MIRHNEMKDLWLGICDTCPPERLGETTVEIPGHEAMNDAGIVAEILRKRGWTSKPDQGRTRNMCPICSGPPPSSPGVPA